MGSLTSMEASLDEEDTGLSVVRLSSWTWRLARASGNDRAGKWRAGRESMAG